MLAVMGSHYDYGRKIGTDLLFLIILTDEKLLRRVERANGIMSRISNRAVASIALFVFGTALSALSAFFAITQLTGHGGNLLWRLTGFYFWTGPGLWGLLLALVPFSGDKVSRKGLIAVDILLLVAMVGTSDGRLNDVVIYANEMPLKTALVITCIALIQVIIIQGSSMAGRLNSRK